MHQAGEFRLPPHRHHYGTPFLLALQLAPQTTQIMQGLLHQRRRRPAAPEIGAIHLGGDRLQHGGQFGRIEAIEMAAHQGQTQPQLVVTAQGGDGASHFGRLQAVLAVHGAEEAEDLDQVQEGVPVAVGPVMQDAAPFVDLQLQLLHATAMLLELLAIAEAMGRMELQLCFQLLHQAGLVQHLAGQVVAGGVHVIATGHGGHRQSQTGTEIVAVAQFAGMMQLGRLQLLHLQAAEFGMQAHHRRAGQQNPDVLVGEAEQ